MTDASPNTRPNTRSVNWTRRETLAALHLYLQLPYGQLHRNQPRIVQLSQWLGRTANAVALKLVNLASLDPQVQASGRRGMGNASSMDKQLWQAMQNHADAVILEAADSYAGYAQQQGLTGAEDVADEVPEIAEGKTMTATVQVRVNQARFRRAVLASYNSVEHGHPKPPQPQQRPVPVGPARPRLRPRPDHRAARLHDPRGRRPAPARLGYVCKEQLGAMPGPTDPATGTLSAGAGVFGGACEAVWFFVRGGLG